MSLASKLKNLRIKKGESLQDVADAVKASKAYVWELESGKTVNPTIDVLKRLADHYGVSVAFLAAEEPSREPNKETDQLLRMYRNLGELGVSDRERIEDIIRSFRKRATED